MAELRSTCICEGACDGRPVPSAGTTVAHKALDGMPKIHAERVPHLLRLDGKRLVPPGIFAISWLAVGARTVQMGTMRALGAQSGDVLVGLFIESALPFFAGCVAGWALSAPMSALLASRARSQVEFPPWFAPLVGLASGLLFAVLSTAAAARGASVSPTEAMRSG